MAKDYYKTLGVDKNASKEDIKKAYKTLAKKYHPDISKETDAESKFKEINEAAAVLGDDQKRASYDQFGEAGPAYGGGGQGGFAGADFSDFMRGAGFDFEDIFDRFFSGGSGFRQQRRGGPAAGANLRFDIEVDLEDVAFGVKKTIIVPKLDICDVCGGKGAADKADIETCGECQGTGYVRTTRRTPFGIFATTSSCSRCQGSGQMIKNPCSKCHGHGRIETKKKITIDIPAGIEEDMRLRVAGEGEAGERGGPHGDLYVVVHVKEHKFFVRDGNDIYIDVPITFPNAVLGTELEVPTLTGTATLKIPAGTQTGTVFKMKGKGIPNLQAYGTGSQNVRVNVDVPEKLSKKERELIEELDKHISKRPNKKGKLFGGLF